MALFELHFILSQSSSFIREDEFHLTKFFNEVTISSACKVHVILLSEEHLYISINALSHANLQHLNYYIQRDRDHVTVRNLVSNVLREPAARSDVALNVKVNVS